MTKFTILNGRAAHRIQPDDRLILGCIIISGTEMLFRAHLRVTEGDAVQNDILDPLTIRFALDNQQLLESWSHYLCCFRFFSRTRDVGELPTFTVEIKLARFAQCLENIINAIMSWFIKRFWIMSPGKIFPYESPMCGMSYQKRTNSCRLIKTHCLRGLINFLNCMIGVIP